MTDLVSRPINKEEEYFKSLKLDAVRERRESDSPADNADEDREVLVPSSVAVPRNAHAVKTAFLAYIAGAISEEDDPQRILSLTLEHTVQLMDALVGEIWLASDDGRHLALASSLSPLPRHRSVSHIPMKQGLLGTAAGMSKTIVEARASEASSYDDTLDRIAGQTDYCLLAVPLQIESLASGVLALYWREGKTVSDDEVLIVESIANLSASNLTQARTVKNLRDYAEQRDALFEMSQEIASGLDLETTINRALQWVGRLVECEASLLWLIKESRAEAELVASLGVYAGEDEPLLIPIGEDPMGGVAKQGVPIIVNQPDGEDCLDPRVVEAIKIAPQNYMMLPLRSRDGPIGILCLLNKIGGSFLSQDLTLVSTAVDMIGIAVSNAKLHARTLSLMGERERLHQTALQSTRLATIGRLSATLSHEINNPMQAIRGALTLSMEELTDSEAIAEYIHLSLEEAERVVNLVDRMQKIYAPPQEELTPICPNTILMDTVAIARKELSRQGVALKIDLADDVQGIDCSPNQVHLVFLSLLLTFADLIESSGGKELLLRTESSNHLFNVELISNERLPVRPDVLDPEMSANPTVTSFSLSFCRDVIISLGGSMHLSISDLESVLSIELPLPGDGHQTHDFPYSSEIPS